MHGLVDGSVAKEVVKLACEVGLLLGVVGKELLYDVELLADTMSEEK